MIIQSKLGHYNHSEIMGNFQAAFERFRLSPMAMRLATILVLFCIVLLITLIYPSSKFNISELESAKNGTVNDVLERSPNATVNEVLEGSKNATVNEIPERSKNATVNEVHEGSKNSTVNEVHEGSKNATVNEVHEGSKNSTVNEFHEGSKNPTVNEIPEGSKNSTVNEVHEGSKNSTVNEIPERSKNATINKVPEGSVQSFKSGPDNNSTRVLPRNYSLHSVRTSGDKLLDGLLASGFDESSCLSRYQSYLYRKDSPHKPSRYLISKLRNYEDLHRQCGPHAKSYKRTAKMLRKKYSRSSEKCKYIVWIPANGLGNRMLSIASTFLYAVLTNRVLLVRFDTGMTGLFCEPFLNSSWIVSMNFPYKDQGIKLQDYKGIIEGNVAKNSTGIAASTLFVDYEQGHNKYFHCDYTQSMIRQVPALIMLSDQYFAPSLFMMTCFKDELSKMFPQKEAVFHHLGRYLFHPSNEAWGLITRFYESYLVKADERIGLQIRVFNTKLTPYQALMNQILSCALKNKLLPELDETKSVSPLSKNRTSKAVFVASLRSEYAENLRTMYWTKPTVTGEIVEVYQASHEGIQKRNNNEQNMKAWSEIYLLSLCDVLVTSGVSTFGYVAQSLGGMKPWILYKTLGNKTRDPPCEHAFSMEPCLHFPPSYDCKGKTKNNFASQFPFIKRCEDRRSGVKMH